MHRSPFQDYFLLALIVGALVLTFFIFTPFLAPLALGAVFAVVLQPLYRRTLVRVSGHEKLASLLTVLVSLVIVLLPVGFLSTQLLFEAQGLYAGITEHKDLPAGNSLVEWMRAPLEAYFPGAGASLVEFSSGIDTYVEKGLDWLIGHVGMVFSSAAALFLDLFIFFITLYYLLYDGRRLCRALIKLSPLQDADDEEIFGRLERAVNSVVKGQLVIALAQGALTGVGFAMFGVPNPVLWGAVAAVASLVPLMGTALVIVPGVFFLFVTGNIFGTIGLGLWGLLAVGLIDNFLGPKLMGQGMHLHPLLVLLSVLGGISFFGPVGVFLGPLTVSLLVALLSVYTYLVGGKTADAGDV